MSEAIAYDRIDTMDYHQLRLARDAVDAAMERSKENAYQVRERILRRARSAAKVVTAPLREYETVARHLCHELPYGPMDLRLGPHRRHLYLGQVHVVPRMTENEMG